MRLTFFLFLIGLAFLVPEVSPVDAQASSIKINEFAAVTDGSNDWVELFNEGSSRISLEGWELKDSLESSPKELSGCIAPGGFRKINFSNRLNNGGDEIRLFDKNNSLIDSLKYFSDKVPVHEKGGSTGRNPEDSENWSAFTTSTPKNTTCKTSSTSSQNYPRLSLSEIFPNPEKGGREWVEIYNPNSSKVALSNWQLIDAANHKKGLSGSVAGKSYKVFYFSSGWLNNSGDSLKLVNPNGKQVEKYQFGESEKGVSFAKDASGAWKVTTTPTPGSVNKISGSNNNIGSENVNSTSNSNSTLNSTGLDSTLGYLTDTFQFEEGIGGIPSNDGKIAGVSEKRNQKNSFATLLIAAGQSGHFWKKGNCFETRVYFKFN
jgi:hypothetical protein